MIITKYAGCNSLYRLTSNKYSIDLIDSAIIYKEFHQNVTLVKHVRTFIGNNSGINNSITHQGFKVSIHVFSSSVQKCAVHVFHAQVNRTQILKEFFHFHQKDTIVFVVILFRVLSAAEEFVCNLQSGKPVISTSLSTNLSKL